jgi:hypothetical protein
MLSSLAIKSVDVAHVALFSVRTTVKNAMRMSSRIDKQLRFTLSHTEMAYFGAYRALHRSLAHLHVT